MSEKTSQYDRVVVFSNPTKKGTPQYATGRRQVEHLIQALGLPDEYYSTDPEAKKTQERMLKILTKGDLLIIMGGDGTINTAVKALVHQDKEVRAGLLVVPVGTANDFSRNRNGELEGDDALTRIMQEGSAVEMSPMHIEVTMPDGSKEEHIAVNNAGFHLTAQAAKRLDSPGYRQGHLRRVPVMGPLIQDIILSTKSIRDMTTTPFYLGQDPKPSHLSDLSIVHAETAAKRFKYDSSHTSPEFRFIPSPGRSKLNTVKAAAKLMTGKYNGEARRYAEFRTAVRPVLGHVDGEVFEVPTGSTVKVGLSDQKIKVHSTRP